MTRIHRSLAWLAALVLIAGCSGGSETDTDAGAGSGDTAAGTPAESNQSNPGPIYLRLGEQLDQPFMALIDVNTMQALTDAARDALIERRDLVRELIAATKMGPCDFGTDFSAGPNALMPQIGTTRQLGRVLRAETFRCAKDGDRAGAVEALEAALRLADHAGSDNVLLSKLVSYAIAGSTMETIETLGERTFFTRADRERLAAALRQIDETNPFDVRSSIERDLQISIDALRSDIDLSDATGIPASLMGGSTRETTAQGIEQIRPALIAAWDGPDAANALAAVESTAGNPLMKAMLPAVSALRRQTDRIIERRNEVLAVLER